MATKLRKLQINEVSLCDAGANQHARVALFKRHDDDQEDDETTDLFKRRSVDDAGRYGRAPKDRDPENFLAGGNGPATAALWTAFDNYRRSGSPYAAFALAWSELDDDGKQAVRDEETAAEVARQAAAAAKQTERRQQMTDEGVMIKGARAVARGELENTIRKSTWHDALRKMAAERQKPGETIEGALARIVKSDADALALFRASIGGVPDDVPAAPAAQAPVFNPNSAYGKLRKIAVELQKADPKLTQYTAFAKAFHANPDLAEASKREQAFA